MIYYGKDIPGGFKSNTFLRREDDILVIPKRSDTTDTRKMINQALMDNREVVLYNNPASLDNLGSCLTDIIHDFNKFCVYVIDITASSDHSGRKVAYSFYVRKTITTLYDFVETLHNKYMNNYLLYGAIKAMRNYPDQSSTQSYLKILLKYSIKGYLPDIIQVIVNSSDTFILDCPTDFFSTLYESGLMDYSCSSDNKLTETITSLIRAKRSKDLKHYLTVYFNTHDETTTKNTLQSYCNTHSAYLLSSPECCLVLNDVAQVAVGQYVLIIDEEEEGVFRSVEEVICYMVDRHIIKASDLLKVVMVEDMNDYLSDDYSDVKIYDRVLHANILYLRSKE